MVFVGMGMSWLYASIIKGVRPQHAPVIIPVGILSVAIGIGIYFCRRAALFVSIAVAFIVILISGYIQIANHEINWFLSFGLLLSLVYLYGVFPLVVRGDEKKVSC